LQATHDAPQALCQTRSSEPSHPGSRRSPRPGCAPAGPRSGVAARPPHPEARSQPRSLLRPPA
jgi:hypothetical protein